MNHDLLIARCIHCESCRLQLTRHNPVIFRGCYPASLMLVGEAPGSEEDDKGVPFIGPSGTLLDKLLERADVPRAAPYITNVVKCRPPQNREPSLEEVQACRSLLLAQVDLVKPRRIVALGRVATMALTATRGPMGVLLGQDLAFFWQPEIPVIPVYHPAYLLRRLDDPAVKLEVQDTVSRLRRAWIEAQGGAA